VGVTRAAIVVVALIFFLAVCCAATTVLVFVSPQEAVIAADSLSNRIEGGRRLMCKVSQASDHMLFAATGTGTILLSKPYLLFDPYDLAKISAGSSRSPHEAAVKYASDAWWPLQLFWRASRSRYLELSPAGIPKPEGPQSFVFVGLDEGGLISASEAKFVEMSFAVPVLRRAIEPVEFGGKDMWFLYRSGVVEDLPSDAEINGWIVANGAPAALKRAIEVQSRATPTLVGGNVSIVRLSREGSIQWIDRGECP